MRTIHYLFILMLINTVVIGQDSDPNTLNGILLDKRTKDPISNAKIFIVGVDECKTVTNGEFRLALGDNYEPGETLTIHVQHKELGSSKVDYTIRKNLPSLTIEMFVNTKLSITGIIQGKNSDKLLEGINVKPVSTYFKRDFEVPQVQTDESGQFFFFLDKRNFTKEIDYIDLTFKDSNGIYREIRNTVDIASIIAIEMEDSNSRKVGTYKVKNFINKVLKVKKGETITIKASGAINYGQSVGAIDPEGKGKSEIDIELVKYSEDPQINFGALMIRFGTNESWKICGKSFQFIVQEDGLLQIYFEVNGKQKKDNYGAFEIEVFINN